MGAKHKTSKEIPGVSYSSGYIQEVVCSRWKKLARSDRSTHSHAQASAAIWVRRILISREEEPYFWAESYYTGYTRGSGRAATPRSNGAAWRNFKPFEAEKHKHLAREKETEALASEALAGSRYSNLFVPFQSEIAYNVQAKKSLASHFIYISQGEKQQESRAEEADIPLRNGKLGKSAAGYGNSGGGRGKRGGFA